MDGRFLHADALTKEKLAQIEALNKMAGERGQSLAQMALSWILKDEDVTSVLIGASRPEQIIQNVEIVQNTKFTLGRTEKDRSDQQGQSVSETCAKKLFANDEKEILNK